MAKLTVVRHGQASFHGANYDCLSKLGEEQSQKLGEHWLRMGVSFDSVYMGPKKRHKQTYEGVATAFKAAGKSFPEPILLTEFDEHQGPGVVKKVITAGDNNELSTQILPANIKGKDAVREYFEKFQKITTAWVRGEVEASEFESWQAFRARVNRGLDTIVNSNARHSVVFTSGGPVSTTSGIVLGLDDEKIMEMSWNVNNGAWAEFVYKDGRICLTSFNALSHFNESKFITLI